MIRRYAVLLSLFLCVGLAACSSSKTKHVDTTEEDAGLFATPTSSADKVGSVPEDALATEEGKSEKTADATAATPTTAPEEKTADAKDSNTFADLSAASTSDVTHGEASAGFSSDQVYVVQKGDTLMKIAFSLYGDLDRWKDLYEWNKAKLKNGGNKLSSGMKLKYEDSGTKVETEKLAHTYQIKKGDTLALIAEDVYGKRKKYKKLQKYNAKLIKNPNVIFAGFTLYYDITDQEVAEAEAHRQAKLARGQDGGGRTSPASTEAPAPVTIAAEPKAAPVIPSVINPAPAAITPPPAAPVAVAPVPVAVPAPASAAPVPVAVPPPPEK